VILSTNHLEQLKKLSPHGRLKYLRKDLLRRPRHYLQDKYGLSTETLKAWENGKVNLTHKSLTRCIDLYHQEGISVTKKWIQTGDGAIPTITPIIHDVSTTYTLEEDEDDSSLMIKEIEFFKKSTPNAVTMLITGKEMMPNYNPGDYIGGRFKHGNNIEKALNKDCIIKTKKGKLLFRRLVRSNTKNRYNLTCLNPDNGTNTSPILVDVAVECVAPVILHRKPDID